MKIHHFTKFLMVVIILTAASPAVAGSNHEPVTANRKAEAMQLKNRLKEIRALDKSQLSTIEKKALRREVRSIKKELAAVSGGVYLSVGAILLIALLLILLL
jgi:hypothetical protein